MDFLFGILITIVVLFIMYNYMSISVSDEKDVNRKINRRNNNSYNNKTIPQPTDSKSNNSINGKFNLRAQMDDYQKQFYLSPYDYIKNN
jgi:hypothetical protein